MRNRLQALRPAGTQGGNPVPERGVAVAIGIGRRLGDQRGLGGQQDLHQHGARVTTALFGGLVSGEYRHYSVFSGRANGHHVSV